MIVAAGAGDGQAQEGLRSRVDLLIDQIQLRTAAGCVRCQAFGPRARKPVAIELLGLLLVVAGRAASRRRSARG